MNDTDYQLYTLTLQHHSTIQDRELYSVVMLTILNPYAQALADK